MKYYAILAILLFTVIGLPETLAMCAVNEDWPDAPCMDMIMNGHYPQEQVDRWSAYHDYKGADNMEAKKQEMTQAIQDGKLQQWVDQSMQNYNVWTYYYFSGEAPSMPNYHDAGFELITRDKMHIQDIISIHNPFWYDPQNWIITAIMASAVITPIIIIWRKRR